MNRLILLIPFVIQIPFLISAQNDETFEIQIDKVDSTSNINIQQFYNKFKRYINTKEKALTKISLYEETMINNFVIFSQDGLLMKDFDFHSVESCKKEILKSRPKPTKHKIDRPNWIFVSMESHVNKLELIEILEFFRKENIEYQFGEEDQIMEKIDKN